MPKSPRTMTKNNNNGKPEPREPRKPRDHQFGTPPRSLRGGYGERRRQRNTLTTQQRWALEASFESCPNPRRNTWDALAKDQGLTVRTIQKWFQNQRAKLKKIQKKEEEEKIREIQRQRWHEEWNRLQREMAAEEARDRAEAERTGREFSIALA